MTVNEKAEKSIIKTYRSCIWNKFIQAVKNYDLIQDGDRIAVCISGGKDSFLMAKLFAELQKHGKQNFTPVYISMDPGYNRQNREKIEYNAKLLNLDIKYFKSDIFGVTEKVGGNPCYLCARMRRGHLYSFAKENGCNKIALGHHFNDVIETVLMGMLYSGQYATMMPKLKSTNFMGMELIRPLYCIKEDDIKKWAKYNGLEFIACACRLTEKSAAGEMDSYRLKTKNLIARLKKEDPLVDINIFKSAHNVSLDQVIEYKQNGVRHNFRERYNPQERLKEE